MIDENIVYVKIKNGIFKCYKSEQMHKPIYYPVESKTNGYIDYNDVEKILTIEDLYQENQELKKQLENYKKLGFKHLQDKNNNLKIHYEIKPSFTTRKIKELQQENQKHKRVIDKLKEWINIVQQNKDNKHLEPFISTDELDELLDISKEVE